MIVITGGLIAILVAPSASTSTPLSSSSLTGAIEIDGSSTVFSITEAVAEEFHKIHPRVQVNVGVSGTGGGFKRFLNGEIDINDASRPIKELEIREAGEKGISYVEISVAIDGLSVVVNPRNDFVQCLTVDELKRMWEPGVPVNRWSQIRPEWPDRPFHLYGPGPDSGTFDYFTEAIVGEEDASRPDFAASEDDNVLVQGIYGDRNGLGYMGYAYYAENRGLLNPVAIDNGDGCVIPTAETIESGDYAPLARPLFIYVNKASLERQEVQVFLKFYLENATALVQEVGYVPLSPQFYRLELEKLQ